MTDKEIKQYFDAMTKGAMFTKLQREDIDCYPVIRPYSDHFRGVTHTPITIINVPNHNKS